ncbi:MRX complex DNA-binding subunit [Martiniozyma asiatica (nom. inval.)]|nr:MRX complex DNA-binding subunit [Martiniozyma asiatica]
MTSLYRLSISGIRAFDDNVEESIKFDTPLTVILGANGCGKTTIIESLRYATTGEVPPNTNKGASFVRDPSLNSSTQTKGKIGLTFKTPKGAYYLTKNVMVTKNNRTKGLSFKTKENQLMSNKNGVKDTMTSKVSDIEQLIPKLLGVNKSILEYVVFCHQEDSLWPISDSAGLKKKFDEIFDSVKFIEALDDMKAISKKLNGEISDLTIRVEHLNEDKKRAIRKRQTMAEMKRLIGSLNDEVIKNQQQIKEDTKMLNGLHKTNQDFESILNKEDSLKQQIESTQVNIERIKSSIEIINDSEEGIMKLLNNFAQVVSGQLEEQEKLKGKISNNEDVLKDKRQILNGLLLRAGEYQAQVSQYHKNIDKRDDFVSKFSSELQVNDDKNFAGNLEKKIRNLVNSCTEKKNQFQIKINDLKSILTGIQNENAKESQHKLYLTTDLTALDEKLTNLKARLSLISSNQTVLNTHKENLINLQSEIQQISESGKIKAFLKDIENTQSLILYKEVDIDNCQKKLQVARANSELITKINVLKEMNSSDEHLFNNALAQVHQIFPSLDANNTSILESDYKMQLASLDESFNKIEKNQSNLMSSISEIKFQLNSTTSNLDNLIKKKIQIDNKIDKIKPKYSEIFNNQIGSDFVKALKFAENRYTEDHFIVSRADFFIDYYERAIKKAKADGSCQLCHRPFLNDQQDDDPEKLEEFIKYLGRTMKKAKRDGNIQEMKNVLDEMKAVESEVLSLENLKIEINLAEDKIKSLNEAENLKTKETDQLKEEMEAVLMKLNKFRKVADDIRSVSMVGKELNERKEEIRKLTEKLKFSGISKNVDELEKEFSDMNRDIKRFREDLENLRLNKEREERKKLDKEAELSKIKLEISNLEMQNMDKINIEKAVEEVTAQSEKVRHSLVSVDKNLAILAEKANEAQKNVHEMENKFNGQISELDEAKTKYETILVHFTNIEESIDQYLSSGVEEKFNKNQQETDEIKKKISVIEFELVDLNGKLTKISEKLANTTNQERNLRANIDYLHDMEHLAGLKCQLRDLDIESARQQREVYMAESDRLQKRLLHYQSQAAGKAGEKTQLERQMAQSQSELDRDYAKIDERYHESFTKLQTKIILATDLTTCYKATDEGILKFHSSQMNKINSIIDDLWHKTYCGNDIQRIRIKFDPVQGKNTKNRSYNYRVVMIKNGTELDMRGRCSAGQKVLASIIIRIALAECFGTNFGMIALDEPTTNLDEENIEALGRALNTIINERRQQSNFQLIVITHDEKFLRKLDANEFANEYWKVERNDRMNSTITRVPLR